MGIRFNCHECGKKLNVKTFLAGKRGICPDCDVRFLIPTESGGTAQPVVKSSASPSAGNGLGPATNLNSAGASAAPQASLTTPNVGSPVARPASTIVNQVASAPATMPASDPLSQSPNSVWYVRPSTGGQFGPAAGDMMRQWIAEGRVAADSLVWREGWAEWQSATALFPQLAASAGGSPVPTAIAPVAAASPQVATPVTTLVTAAAAPVLGPSSQASTGSTLPPVKKSNGLTALMVIMLVLVAIVLMVVFAYVLYRQGGNEEYKEARRSEQPAHIAQAWDQEPCQRS